MVIPLNILSGTSISLPRNPTTSRVIQTRIPPTPPQQTISPLDKASGGALAFPNDRGKYYMTFDIYQYTRSSLYDLGGLTQGSGISHIVLPLPATLTDVNEVQWDDNVQLGNPVTGIADIVGKSILNNLFDKARFNPVVGAIGAAGDAVSNGAQAYFGYAPNQFITLLFRGPTYKKHHFLWQFSPHSQDEANNLRQIANVFKNAMAPSYAASTGGLAWQYPKIFWPAIWPNSMFMYKFKPMILNKFAVNYTGGGKPAFYKNTDPTRAAPEGLIFDMAFTEIEYWTEGNFNNKIDPFDVYTTTAFYNASGQT